MEFTIDRNTFKEQISRVFEICQVNSTIRSLNYILIQVKNGEVTLTATDLVVVRTTRFPAVVVSEGDILVNAEKVNSFAENFLPGDVTVKNETNDQESNVSISCNQTVYYFHVLPVDEFPLVNIDSTCDAIVTGEDFLSLISHVEHAMSTNEEHSNLCGIYLHSPSPGYLRAIATDGDRLHLYETGCLSDLTEGITIPHSAVSELRRFLGKEPTCMVGMKGPRFVLIGENQTMSIRLMDTTFPNYQRIMVTPTNNRLVADRESLKAAVSRVALVLTKESNIIRFNLKDKGDVYLEYALESTGMGREVLPGNPYVGSAANVAVNWKLIVDALSSANSEDVILSFSGPQGGVTITAESGFLAIIMPVRE